MGKIVVHSSFAPSKSDDGGHLKDVTNRATTLLICEPVQQTDQVTQGPGHHSQDASSAVAHGGNDGNCHDQESKSSCTGVDAATVILGCSTIYTLSGNADSSKASPPTSDEVDCTSDTGPLEDTNITVLKPLKIRQITTPLVITFEKTEESVKVSSKDFAETKSVASKFVEKTKQEVHARHEIQKTITTKDTPKVGDTKCATAPSGSKTKAKQSVVVSQQTGTNRGVTYLDSEQVECDDATPKPKSGQPDASAVMDTAVCGTDTDDTETATNHDAFYDIEDHAYCTGCIVCVNCDGRVTIPANEEDQHRPQQTEKPSEKAAEKTFSLEDRGEGFEHTKSNKFLKCNNGCKGKGGKQGGNNCNGNCGGNNNSNGEGKSKISVKSCRQKDCDQILYKCKLNKLNECQEKIFQNNGENGVYKNYENGVQKNGEPKNNEQRNVEQYNGEQKNCNNNKCCNNNKQCNNENGNQQGNQQLNGNQCLGNENNACFGSNGRGRGAVQKKQGGVQQNQQK